MKTPFHKPLKWLLIVILIIPSSLIIAQEICDNGIDDDGDGLIDINDEQDCLCGDIAFDVINADFENFTCCPDNVTFLPDNGIYCLNDGWGPASLGTSDYYNTCDFLGGAIVPEIPQPIPSGEGAIGMFTSGTYEETVGTCLTNTLIDGESYDLSFYVGFHEDVGLNSPLNMNIVVYGTPNCDDFPVSGFNCLDTYGEWEIITIIPVTGTMDNSWVFVSTSFVSTLNAEAIAFSNECVSPEHYHFLDDITLEGVFVNEEIGDEISMSGDCVAGVELEVPFAGGATYQWYLEGVAIIGANSNTHIIPNADQEGNYQVVVTNGLSCTISPPLEVLINEDVLDLDGDITNVNCIGNDDGAIELIIDSPNLPFDIDWSNGESSENLIGLQSGNYEVTVIDNNGCIGDATFEVLDPPSVNAIFMGDCNTGVEVSVDPINSNETYQWYYEGSLVPGATTNPYLVPTDAQGEYYVVITNGINCQNSVPINIFFNTSILNITGESNDVLCFDEETGSIDIEIENDNGPYEYEWSNGWLGQDLENIGVGEYTVTVSDDYGCSGTATYTIDQPSELFNFANVVQPSGGIGGEATIVSNGGVQPYSYVWSNGNETNSDNDLQPGTYTVIVTDANGCEDIVIFNIEGDFIVLETIVNAGCHNECNGSISLMVDGPSGDYLIAWDDPQLEGFDLIELCSGSYAYTVADDNGGEFSGVAVIADFDSLEIEVNHIDTLCSDLDSIIIASSISGGTAPYSYLWSNGSVNDSLFDVTIGQYNLTVTDANLCMDSISMNIYQYEPPIINANIIAAGCDGEATGGIDLSLLNGVEPISYLWDNGDITQDITGLISGNYNVQIIDGNGCSYNELFVVGINPSFDVFEVITDVNCQNENDGSIILDIQNGIEPYTINWNHGPVSTALENLSPGQYSVNISDASGCTATYDYEIELLSSISVEAVVENNFCIGEAEGSISLTIDANGNDYSIVWNDNSLEESRENLNSGIYNLEIIDEFGCTYNFDYEILQLGEPILYEVEITPDTCGSEGIGSIRLIPISGSFPFSYLWENNSEESYLENLEAGVYALTISDANGCQVITQEVVNSISDLSLSVNSTPIICAGSSTASVTLIPEGGTEPFVYLWDDNSSSSTISNLQGNTTYAFTVTDAEGCVGVGNVQIEDTLTNLQIVETLIEPLCYGDSGEIILNVSGGVEPYIYFWSNNDINSSINVLSGSYDVVVTDLLGCTATASYTLQQPDILTLTTINIINPTESNDNGSIEIAVEGGESPYTIVWSNQELTTNNVGLSAGDYSVIVTDNNGCIDSLNFTLVSEIPLSAEYNISNNSCFGDCFGSIVVNVWGGIEPYVYLWSDGTSLDSINQLCNGSYELEITDASGASIQSGIISITSPEDILINGVVYDITCLEAQDGSITIDVLGGTAPFEYSWNNDAEGDSISNLNNGSYQVVAVDNNGCTETAQFTLDDIPLIDVEFEILEVQCGDQDYTLEIEAENNLNYPFILNEEVINLNENNQLQGLTAGQYSLSYLINENCEVVIDDFSLFPIPEYQLSISTQTVEVNAFDTVSLFLEILSDQNLMNYTVHWLTANSYNCISLSNIGECIAIELVVEMEEELLMVFTDQYGCETFLGVNIELQAITPEIYFPNIFSPNGDGRNDEFVIQSNDDETELKSFNIYDRWGNLIFSQQNIRLSQAKSWDGIYNGSVVNPGVYIYVAEVEFDGVLRSFYGDLTLVN